MEIRLSNLQDVEEILNLYCDARSFMRENGNSTQWGAHYPSEELILQDIKDKKSYVCEEAGKILATFYYVQQIEDPTYRKIEAGAWISDLPYGVVHRITSKAGRKGAASYCINWCYDRCGHLRMDTHQDNRPMQQLLHKLGFQKCGIIYVQDGTPRIAYEKIGK